MSNQKYKFRNLTKTVVAKMLSDEECHLIDVPKEYVKSSTVDVKAVKISEGILAPFLCCAKCKTLYSWYELINEKWVNQSGYGVAIQPSIKCGSALLLTSKDFLKPRSTKSPPALANAWQKNSC